MDTSGFDIQFDNHIPENGYRIEGYLCNANNAKECQAIMVRSEPFHQIDYSAMGNYWTLGLHLSCCSGFFCRCGTGNKDGSYCLNANL
jgi:hypothetical protein